MVAHKIGVVGMKKYYLALSIGLAMLLAACGGGTSSSSSSSDSTAQMTLKGAVVDGTIKGAKVCLDVNSNGLCDSSEPSAITGADGTYSFTYTGSIAGMHVLALVGTDAFDSDTGPVTTPYNMLAPASAPSYVTPLTTMISSEMLSSKGTAEEAEKTVKASLGLDASSTLLGKNVMDDTTLHAIAQITAVAMASAKEAIAGNAAAKDMSPADVLKQSINLVRTQVLNNVVGAGGKLNVTFNPNDKPADILAQVNSKLSKPISETVAGTIVTIVSASKSGDGSVVKLADVFKQGLMIVEQGSASYSSSTGQTAYVDHVLKAQFAQFDIATVSASGIDAKQRVLINNQWVNSLNSTDNEPIAFDGTNWVQAYDGLAKGVVPIISGNCVSSPITKTGSLSQTFCGVSKDLSGQAITTYLPHLCDADQGPNQPKNYAKCDPKAVFPANSIAYDFTRTITSDWYQLYGSLSWTGYTGNDGKPITSITGDSGLLSFMQTSTLCRGYNIIAKLKTGDKNSKAGTIKWAQTNNSCSEKDAQAWEDTNFTVLTVGGKEILKVEIPNVYRKINPGDQHMYMIFGYVQGSKYSGMYNGDFTAANTKATIQFTGDPSNGTQVVSPVLFDAAVKQMGIASYPY
jgi:hypothetical protein